MRIFRVIRDRWRAVVARDVVTDEIREEVDFHLEMRAREYERRGWSARAAKREARRRFGNPAATRDRGYDVRGGGPMESILLDARYGARLLLKQRGFSLVALATLALGIGATTALFGVIDAAMIRPLPYPQPEELVQILTVDVSHPDRTWAASLADLDLWRASSRSFSHMGTWSGGTAIVIDGEPERASVQAVSSDYLDVFGVHPALGRFFSADDERLNAAPVVLIGADYWRRHFNGDPAVIGRAIHLASGPATIVGVVPASFSDTTAIWQPLQAADAERRQRQYNVSARLRAGVTLARAQAEMESLPVRVAPGGPGSTITSVRLTSLYERRVASYRSTIGVLAGAVGFVLLIACVNVASLQLARGATRERELAVRASIGATRGRLVRQLLIENVILSLAGAVLGAGLAWLAFDTLVANVPIRLPPDVTAAVDLRVLASTLVLATAAGLAFGLAPALRLSRVAPTLNVATRGARSALTRRAGRVLVALEIAAAVILLTGGALMMRSFQRLSAIDVGFRPDDIYTLEAAPVDPAPVAYNAYYPALLARLRALPGVIAAGATGELPLDGSYSVGTAFTDGPDGNEPQFVDGVRVLPGYFQAIGMRVLAGRVLDDFDRTSGHLVAVLSERAARRLFPGAAPLGHRVQYSKTWYDIIGVVSDISTDDVYQTPSATPPQVYLPYSNTSSTTLTGTPRGLPLIVVVRPRGDAATLPAAMREAAQAAGRQAVVRRVRTGRDWWNYSVTLPRQRTVLLGLLGGLGLLLALVGVFGVTSFTVARRTPEIGVRMALGATPARIVRTVVGDSLVPIVAGIAVGATGALFVTRVIAAFLYKTTPRDPVTFLATVVVLAVLGVIASWLPARQAARVDPVIALRSE